MILNPGLIDAVGAVVGVVLTLMIFSYLLGDNPLYRVALYLFIGATVGYASGVLCWEVLIVRVALPLFVRREYLLLVPVALGLLLLVKSLPKQAYIGNVSVAFIVGVGAAVAASGALVGALVPQIGATGRAVAPGTWQNAPLKLADGVLIVVGTVCTLLAFTYVIGKGRFLRGVLAAVAAVGRGFLVVAFAVAFGGALTAALTIFIGRMRYLIDFVQRWFGL